MNEHIKELIKEHFKNREYDEICGYVFCDSSGSYGIVKSENTSDDKDKTFVAEPGAFLEAEKMGEVVAFYHSHFSKSGEPCDKFSIPDIDASEESCLPFILYVGNTEEFKYHIPNSCDVNDKITILLGLTK